MCCVEWRQAEEKGRGVFARRAIPAGGLIERAPVIVFPAGQSAFIEKTVLDDYAYRWDADAGTGAIVLGFGMLYNHATEPNAVYVRRFEEKVMEFLAVRDIAEGEEVSINYNGPGGAGEVWFEVRH